MKLSPLIYTQTKGYKFKQADDKKKCSGGGQHQREAAFVPYPNRLTAVLQNKGQKTVQGNSDGDCKISRSRPDGYFGK